MIFFNSWYLAVNLFPDIKVDAGASSAAVAAFGAMFSRR